MKYRRRDMETHLEGSKVSKDHYCTPFYLLIKCSWICIVLRIFRQYYLAAFSWLWSQNNSHKGFARRTKFIVKTFASDWTFGVVWIWNLFSQGDIVAQHLCIHSLVNHRTVIEKTTISCQLSLDLSAPKILPFQFLYYLYYSAFFRLFVSKYLTNWRLRCTTCTRNGGVSASLPNSTWVTYCSDKDRNKRIWAVYPRCSIQGLAGSIMAARGVVLAIDPNQLGLELNTYC